MKKTAFIASLLLLSLISNAETVTTDDFTPAVAVTPTNTNPEEARSWRGLVTTLGVVGGVIIADLFMGGSLTSSLIGWGSTAAVVKGPVIYPPEVLSARAAGAVLGEMITPATNLRDVAARQDMIYSLMLGVGGAVGAVVSSLWASTMDSDMDNNPTSK